MSVVKVSVVLCTYSENMYEHFREAAESVLRQTYDNIELIVVVDGNQDLFERVSDEYDDHENVVVHCNDENVGLSESRNIGVDLSSGDVIAFMDDDAVADPQWIRELISSYQEHDALAAGGKMTPRWVAGKPSFLPEEFYWLVGVTHRGFADGPGEVRNTFGSNISFRREVIEELDGFDAKMGRQGDKNLQSEETLLCAEMRGEFGKGVWYNPDAVVQHKVFDYRTDLFWLLDRAFWQGYSKRAMEGLVTDSNGEESAFLWKLVTNYVPQRLWVLLNKPRREKVVQLVMLVVFTAVVGAGYLYGIAKY